MYCTRCGTNNAKTAKFCRECGRRLELGVPQPTEEEQVEEQPEEVGKVGELAHQAFQSFEAGSLDDAVKLCYDALRIDPRSTDAHSLLGRVLERKGDLPGAIRHYERVLAINPKSAADRVKLSELRARAMPDVSFQTLDQRITAFLDTVREFLVRTHPWPAAIAAAAVTFIVLVALWPKPQAPSPQVPPAGPQASASPSTPQAAGPPVPGSGGTPQFIGTPPAVPAGQPEYTDRGAAAVTPQAGAGSRRQAPAAGARPVEVPSISIVPRPIPSPPRPAPPAATPPRPGGGTITIQPSGNGGASQTSPVDRARQLQMSGQYEEAIAAWKQALSGSTNAGQVHQMIATCYKRLGRNRDAVGSFQDAISAYKQQVAAGSNVDEAQRGIRSSELGIKISQREGG